MKPTPFRPFTPTTTLLAGPRSRSTTQQEDDVAFDKDQSVQPTTTRTKMLIGWPAKYT
jgi:hypothetical protein